MLKTKKNREQAKSRRETQDEAISEWSESIDDDNPNKPLAVILTAIYIRLGEMNGHLDEIESNSWR